MDLMEENMPHLIGLVKNEIYPLGLGRVGVRCRTQQEQLAGEDFPSIIEKERRWIAESGLEIETGPGRLGIPTLRETLSKVLINRVCNQLPDIISQLDHRIDASKKNSDFLSRLANEPNMTTVARELEKLVNQMHPSADQRRDFEEELRSRIFEVTREKFSVTADTTSVPRHFDFEKINAKDTTQTDKPSVKGARTVLSNTGYESGRHTDIAEFRELLVFGGEGHMDGIDNAHMDSLQTRTVQIGACSAFFTTKLPENPRRSRSAWVHSLHRTIDDALGGGDYLAEVFKVCQSEIAAFAERSDVSGERGELAKMYFAYILDKISTRIHEESLRQELVGMVERERRPVADMMTLNNEIAKWWRHPQDVSWLTGGDGVLEVEMFNRAWTASYMQLMTDRVSEDIFRILSVRLLEPLVFESIQFSLTMFSGGGSVAHEAKANMKHCEELQLLRGSLQATLDRYTSSGEGAASGGWVQLVGLSDSELRKIISEHSEYGAEQPDDGSDTRELQLKARQAMSAHTRRNRRH